MQWKQWRLIKVQHDLTISFQPEHDSHMKSPRKQQYILTSRWWQYITWIITTRQCRRYPCCIRKVSEKRQRRKCLNVFLFKCIYGANNINAQKRVAHVCWHDSRLVHVVVRQSSQGNSEGVWMPYYGVWSGAGSRERNVPATEAEDDESPAQRSRKRRHMTQLITAHHPGQDRIHVAFCFMYI